MKHRPLYCGEALGRINYVRRVRPGEGRAAMSTISRERLLKLANHYLESRLPDDLADIDDDELFTDWADDLIEEFDAALEDRWLQWLRLRQAHIPLGERVVDVEYTANIIGELAEIGAARREMGRQVMRGGRP